MDILIDELQNSHDPEAGVGHGVQQSAPKQPVGSHLEQQSDLTCCLQPTPHEQGRSHVIVAKHQNLRDWLIEGTHQLISSGVL
jgi:hypothetical protein